MGAVIAFYLIGLRLVFQTFFQHILDIGNRPALAGFGKLERDEGIEAHTTGTKERQVVDDTVVKQLDVAGIDDIDGFLSIHRYAKMPSQTVSRTAWNDTESCLTMRECTGNLIHSTVASNGHNCIDTPSHAVPCYFCSMTRITRELDFIVIAFMIQPGFNQGWNLIL